MGSQKDVMELFAERDIRQLFSEYDGWNVAPVAGLPSAKRVYQAKRGNWGGREEVAFIAVSFDPVPQVDSINALDIMPNGQSPRPKKYLLTPQATNTSSLPPHIRILPMKAFAFAEGKLAWLTKKQNAKRCVLEPATVS